VAKVMFLVTKRADLSREEFQRYWREVHAPLVAKMPGLRRYTQDRVVPDPQQGDSPLDGVAELWFDSLDAFQAALAAPEGQAVLADVPNFLDATLVKAVAVDEVAIV
jgi:uncharacterized protein (TIGR02118 family)